MASAAGLSPISPVVGTPEPARPVIERFLLESGEPVLTEDGEGLFALTGGGWALEERNGRLTIQVWNEARTLARRVIGVESQSRGRLVLRVERFGRRAGILTLIDVARPSTTQHHRRTARLEVRETFRRFLRRWYPEFHIVELTTGAVLTESLSPNFPRAFLRSGAEGWAAIAAPADPLLTDQALSFGLIWLDYLRRRESTREKAREKACSVRGLILYLPAGHERTTCLRLRFLDGEAACWRVWAYTADGVDFPIDLADYGNLDTEVEPCRGITAAPALASEELAQNGPRPRRRSLGVPDFSGGAAGGVCVSGEPAQNGASAGGSGVPLRAQARRRALCAFEKPAPDGPPPRRRSPRVPDPGGGAARGHCASDRAHAELWLESQVRTSLRKIDPALLPEPVYGQVPAFAATAHGLIDLLAADAGGHVSVIELKASEDIQLPLQALDYWMRVRWHLERGDFAAAGYFPGVELRREPPRLLLVAPALMFHPASEVILRYFSPEVAVERIGVGIEWQKSLRVLFRASSPCR